jgi:amidase
MSNSVAGCKTFLKVIAESKPWLKDAMAIRKPWNEDEYNLVDHNKGRMLCFGILWDDEVMRPHPPVIRALERVKAALGKARHKVVDWNPHKHAEIYSTLVSVRSLPYSCIPS